MKQPIEVRIIWVKRGVWKLGILWGLADYSIHGRMFASKQEAKKYATTNYANVPIVYDMA